MSDALALNRVHVGDIRDLAPRLEKGSVNCIVTSPPYLGLRDYGTARWEGGDAGCDHVARYHPQGRTGQRSDRSYTQATKEYRDICGKCGARRVDRQIGLEANISDYIETLVGVFRALRPALRDDGTLWVNLGDSYSAGGNGGGATTKQASNVGSHLPPKRVPGFPPKCLLMVPARFALAMIDDGWVLRSQIRWCKRAAMPESVTDRPTSAVEEIFLFAKTGHYWYDAEAVKEPNAEGAVARFAGNPAITRGDKYRGMDGQTAAAAAFSMPEWLPTGRNARNFMLLGPEPFADAHYATFPSSIPRFAIRAGCPPRVCARCGTPWKRLVERETVPKEKRTGRGWLAGIAGQDNWESGTPTHSGLGNDDAHVSTTLGWAPTCAHEDAGFVPGTVLDPFMGSGTTAMVAVEEGRRWLGIDLDERAVEWCRQRLDGRQIRMGGLEAAG